MIHMNTARQHGLALLASASLFTGLVFAPAAVAGPNYDFTRPELESILDDLIAWLPGSWDNYPQVHFERKVRTPVDGEHDHWHRVFARIDAPQLGEVVFYGQINAGGRDQPMMHRTQILYTARIDEQRGVVLVNGQGPLNPEDFVNLHERPELWSKVQMRDPASLKCDFLWRRDGEQIVGVLDAKAEEGRNNGPGTCSYLMAGSDVEFFADAEWVLGPETLWDYDVNTIGGALFVGRDDRTHKRLSRATGYQCRIEDRSGARDWHAHNRGAHQAVTTATGEAMRVMLLRVAMPDADGRGMHDRLRLMFQKPASDAPVVEVVEAAKADSIRLEVEGVKVSCKAAPTLARMHK
jgi:CheY-like chemotaxis protein